MSDPLAILQRSRTIAIVGASGTPGKDAHEIPKFVAEHYEVHPVNPSATELFGRQAYKSLADVPRPIDLVNVFRPSEEAPAVARAAVEAGAKALWLQTGITSPEARQIAEDAGIDYAEDVCIRVAARRLLASGSPG